VSNSPALEAILSELLLSSEHTKTVGLDDIGAAVGTAPVSADQIDALIEALEAAGRTVGGAEGLSGVAALQEVVAAARKLAAAGVRPRVADLATATGLSESEVRKGLLFARVLGRLRTARGGGSTPAQSLSRRSGHSASASSERVS